MYVPYLKGMNTPPGESNRYFHRGIFSSNIVHFKTLNFLTIKKEYIDLFKKFSHWSSFNKPN